MSTEIEIFAPVPWERRKSENENEYALFCHFRDTHPLERHAILPDMCVKFAIEAHELKEIAARNLWINRVAKFDAWNDASYRQGIHRKKRELGASLIALSGDLIKKSENAIQYLVDQEIRPSYREAVEMARLAIELQRAGFGLSGVGSEVDTGQRTESPSEFIQAAVQVNVMIKQEAEKANVKPEDVIDADFVSEE